MKGGEISGNIASGTTVSNIGDSPAVLLGRKGKFTMNGGLITNNTRGVVISGPEAEFTMEGGSITNNGTEDPAPPPDPPNPRGLRGGGVCVGVNLTGGTFKMNGGTISGNGVNPAAGALDTPGGGVYVAAKNGYPTFDGGITIALANHVCLTSASPGQYPFITLGPGFTVSNPKITLDLAATRREWVLNWVGQKVLDGNPSSIAALKDRFVLGNFYYSSGNKPFDLYQGDNLNRYIIDNNGVLILNPNSSA